MVGGGFKAIQSVLRYSARIGPWQLYRAVRSKNACKACAFGTGGQRGGIHNERGRGIEVCNKNIQAHLSDIRAGIPNSLFLEKSIAELSGYTGKQLEDVGRLVTPLYKKTGDKHYSPITYADALRKMAARLRATPPERSFFYASGRSSNEAAFCLQLLARLYGTNNINNCSYYCHQASGVGLTATIGTGTATVEYDDLDRADLIFVIGANPASNHPRYLKSLIRCRRRGGKVIVVNPAKEAGLVRFASPSDLVSMLKGGEAIASTYVQPHLGGDIAFLQGVCKHLIENDAIDRNFIDTFCDGFTDFRANILALPWQDISFQSGVSRNEIEAVAKIYSKSRRAILSWSMGLTHHLHGVHNIETVVALALLRGMIGRPGAGLLPLRGHSNIQGTGSVGFTPKLKAAIEERLQAKLKHQLPTQPGLDTMGCMEAAQRGEMDIAVMLGGNLAAATPDTAFAIGALNTIPFKVFINSTLNQSHVHGVDGETIILPPRVRDEETQPTTQESMFNYVRLSDGGIDRFPQLMSEVAMICELGRQLIPEEKFDFTALTSHARIRQWLGDVVPGFEKLHGIDSDKEEFHIGGRILHQPLFNTPSGKARFRFHSPPARPRDGFLLTTVRSEGQFNSIIYHEEDTYRGQTRRDVVLMHPEDIKQQGLKTNQRVTLATNTGRLENLAVRPFDVRRGNLMTYYPEANVLIPKAVDNQSQTPAFKSIPVTLEA